MKVLVTGGAGFIGGVCAGELLAAGAKVVVLDNLSTGHARAVPSGAEFVHGDLRSRQTVGEVFARHRPDAVLHFAAKTVVGESMQRPMDYLGENVQCGINLLDAVCEHGVQRFVLSSTANLFGDPERLPITETERIVPGSPYGEGKFILERMLAWLDRTKGVRYAALRYFNAAGATATHGEDQQVETHLIPLVLDVALGKRDKIVIFGGDYPTPDGTCVRDYVHVADLAQAHLLALAALERGCCTYNLGNGTGYSVRQVVDTARALTGHAIPAEIGPRRAGDPANLVASSDAIRRDLGWQPRFPKLHQIVESAWAWRRSHSQGYGK